MTAINHSSISPDGQYTNITLPDESIVKLDRTALCFESVSPVNLRENPSKLAQIATMRSPTEKDLDLLIGNLKEPQRLFSNCFRRITDHPRYSAKGSNDFVIRYIYAIYKFPRYNYGGGLLTRFLDGGIITNNYYGWGIHAWEVVYGAEAMRALCLFFGIKQPYRIKGEPPRRALSLLLEEMTHVPTITAP